jgi:hypothetical protein
MSLWLVLLLLLKMKLKEQIIKLGIIVIMVAALSTSSEALEHKCETDLLDITQCRWIIKKF